MCINHEWNGDAIFDPVRALARRYVNIREHIGDNWNTFLLAVFSKGVRSDITDNNICHALKLAAAQLDYPASRGIPIDRIDMHSLQIGGTNTLALAGYSDSQNQKMGRWQGATFKEYVREQLSVFSEGMSSSMRNSYGFINVEGGVFHNVTNTVMAMACTTTGSPEA